MASDGFTWHSEVLEAWEGLETLGNTQGRSEGALEHSNSRWGFSIVGVVVVTVMGA